MICIHDTAFLKFRLVQTFFFLLRLETHPGIFRPVPYQFPHLTLTLGALINWGYTCQYPGREGHVAGLISAIWAV